jgi:hypothetical protein
MPQLTESLQEIATAFDQARALGLPVSVPDALYLACLAVVSRHDLPDDAAPTGSPTARHPAPAVPGGPAARRPGRPRAGSHGRAVAGVEVSDVPLRRLIWQVISPGEQFTVTDVAERVAALGAFWTPSAVSNALGYWASRGRLTREHKGAYRYTQPSSVAAAVTGERARQQETPAASPDRAAMARREEDDNVPSAITRGKAAS